MRDCEVIVAAPGGAPDFEAVMERFMSKKSAHQIVYCVFDVSTKTVGQPPTSRSLWRKTVLNSLELNHPIEGIQAKLTLPWSKKKFQRESCSRKLTRLMKLIHVLIIG